MYRKHRLAIIVTITTILATALGLGSPAFAQSPATATGTLRGQVSDPSGAMVANASVAVLVSGGRTYSATTSKTGTYEIANLPPGK
jgi:hypothetical protein